MITYKRVCLKDLTEGDLVLVRGKEYITSEQRNGHVVVFDKYWFNCSDEYFAGEIRFT